jgi:hypothetical protein
VRRPIDITDLSRHDAIDMLAENVETALLTTLTPSIGRAAAPMLASAREANSLCGGARALLFCGNFLLASCITAVSRICGKPTVNIY